MDSNDSGKPRGRKATVTGALGRVLDQVRSGDFSPEKRGPGQGADLAASGVVTPAPRFYPSKGFAKVPADVCRPWALADRPDSEFEHQADVARSLRDDGQIQPAVVRILNDPAHPSLRYEVIAGQVRWRAAKEAGVDLEVTIRELNDEAAFRLMVGENEFRRNLSDYARAKRLARSLEAGIYKDKSALAKACGMSPSQLSYLLGFAELDPVIVARARQISSIPARLGYVLNNAARSGYREHILRDLAKIESGEIARDQIPSLWEKGAAAGKTVSKHSDKPKAANARATEVRGDDGKIMYTVVRSGESGPVVRFSKTVGKQIGQGFWEQMRELVERHRREA